VATTITSSNQSVRLSVKVYSARNLSNRYSTPDRYAIIRLGTQEFKTKVAKNGGCDPTWHEEFAFDILDSSEKLELEVFETGNIMADGRLYNNNSLGRCTKSVHELVSNGAFDGDLPLFTSENKPAGNIFLAVGFASSSDPPEENEQKLKKPEKKSNYFSFNPEMKLPHFDIRIISASKLISCDNTTGRSNPICFIWIGKTDEDSSLHW
jgi:Ca2+-dependent lipid-binding protein